MTFEKDMIDIVSRLNHAVQCLYLQHKFATGEVCSDYEQAVEDIYARLDRIERSLKKKSKE